MIFIMRIWPNWFARMDPVEAIQNRQKFRHVLQ
jgi:hypothetical protein